MIGISRQIIAPFVCMNLFIALPPVCRWDLLSGLGLCVRRQILHSVSSVMCYTCLFSFYLPSAYRCPLHLHAEEAEKKADLRAGFFAVKSVGCEHIFAPPFVCIGDEKSTRFSEGFCTTSLPCATNCCRPSYDPFSGRGATWLPRRVRLVLSVGFALFCLHCTINFLKLQ